MFEQGAFREAVEVYDAVLAQNPHDEKAVAGLKLARTRFIDSRLIQVRKARLALDQELAIEMLLEVVTLEKQWAYFPGGAIAGTQEEESIEALSFVENKIGSAQNKDRPLSALYLLTHYEPIFSGNLNPRREFLLRRLAAAGKRQCSSLSRSLTDEKPYYSEFVRKVCSAWGQPGKDLSGARATKLSELYGRVVVHTNVKGLSSGGATQLRKSIENTFRESPWFEIRGSRVLHIHLKGDYTFSHSRSPVERVHGYQVQIPFTEYQTVEKPPKGPKGESEYRPVTRYRTEPRIQKYDGWNHKQSLDLHLQGDFVVAGTPRTVRYEKQLAQLGFEHHWNLPQIGLEPETPALESPETWIEQQAILLAADILNSTEEAWEQRYCESSSNEPTLMATGDQIHRCLRFRRSSPPQLADAWYEKFFGLTFAQANELLKLADL